LTAQPTLKTIAALVRPDQALHAFGYRESLFLKKCPPQEEKKIKSEGEEEGGKRLAESISMGRSAIEDAILLKPVYYPPWSLTGCNGKQKKIIITQSMPHEKASSFDCVFQISRVLWSLCCQSPHSPIWDELVASFPLRRADPDTRQALDAIVVGFTTVQSETNQMRPFIQTY